MSVVLVAACGGNGTEPGSNADVRYVSVNSSTGGALPGTTVQFTAAAFDSVGGPVTGAHIRWATQDSFLATVDASGLVTALHPGTVEILAMVDTVIGGFGFVVLEPVAQAELHGVRAPVVPGAEIQLPFVLRSAVGDTLTTTFRALAWSSSDPLVAEVSADGLITTRAPGSTTITVAAPVEGVSASVALDVAKLQFVTAQEGGGFTCGVTTGHRVYCWGNGYEGAQADGTVLLDTSPWPVNIDVLFDSLSVGHSHACALTAAGAPYCWGVNAYGALGDGTTTSRLTPAPVSGGLALASIAVGLDYTCGLQADGAALCWGWNDWGNLGTGDREPALVPRVAAAGLQLRTISLSPDVQTGGPHTCGLTVAGNAYCWGANEWGQLASYPRTQIQESATLVQSPTALVDVQSGGQHGCGLTADGTVLCWGDNEGNALGDRQLDYPNIDSIPAPVPGAPAFVQVRTGLYRSCGLTGGGDAYCWGDLFGKTPVHIPVPQALIRLDVASHRFCGMSAQAVAWCWTLPGAAATKVEGQ
jgi:hypothetical protein